MVKLKRKLAFHFDNSYKMDAQITPVCALLVCKYDVMTHTFFATISDFSSDNK